MRSTPPFGLDPRALAIYRIALGCVFIAELFKRLLSLEAFYTDQGMLPRDVAIRLFNDDVWSLFLSTGSYGGSALIFTLAILVGIAFTLGYRTRLMTVLVYILTVSFEYRNPLVINGAEHVLRLVTFWNIFIPLGQRYSLDALRSSRSEHREINTLGTALLTLQFFAVYFFSALAKLGNENWTSGLGLLNALTLEHYNRSLAPFLLRFLPDGVIREVCYLVLLVEVLAPVLLLCPFHRERCRATALLLLTPLQLSFGLFLEVHFFPFIMTAASLPFLPVPLLDWVERRTMGLRRRLASFFLPIAPLPRSDSRELPLLSSVGNSLQSAFLFLCVCYLFAVNIESLRYKSPAYRRLLPASIVPDFLEPLGSSLKLRQAWDMFINPGERSYWFVASAKTRGGTLVDALRPGSEGTDWSQPTSYFENELWRSFLINATSKQRDELAPLVIRYLCKRWNREIQGRNGIREVSLFVVSQVHPKYDPLTPRRFVLLGRSQCE